MIFKKFKVSKMTLLVAAAFILFAQPIYSQSQEKIYSALMLNFARGMQWPSDGRNNFVIGVLEYPPLAAELISVAASRKINSKKIEVKEFTHAGEVGKCNMLFIPAYKAKQLTAVLDKIGADPTLVITNKMDLAKKGSGVNFVLIDGKLRYEINLKSIEKRGMKISANVKNMGIIVE